MAVTLGLQPSVTALEFCPTVCKWKCEVTFEF